MFEPIVLTGEVLEWNELRVEEHAITASEVPAYERNGFSIARVGGLLAFKTLDPLDGDITIQPKSDLAGREASIGGHANFGYSGYFRGYVFLRGKRKRLVDFYGLFGNQEHHYAAQYLKADAERSIREKIAALAGRQVSKVKGGYAFGFSKDAEE